MNNDKLLQRVSGSYLLLALVFVAAVLAWSNGLSGAFIWDDLFFFVDNARLAAPLDLRTVFTSDIWDYSNADEERSFLYRPLTTIIYWVLYQCFGSEVWGYHVSKLVLHLMNGVLLGFFLRQLFPGVHACFLALAMAIFLLHPTHVESVTWIIVFSDLLALGLLLLSLIGFLKYLRSGSLSACIVALISYLLALLNKETVLFYPLLLFVVFFDQQLFTRDKAWYRYAVALGSACVLSLVYFLARAAVMDSMVPAEMSWGAESFFAFFYLLLGYIERLLFPWPYEIFISSPEGAFFTVGRSLGALAVASVLVFWCIRAAIEIRKLVLPAAWFVLFLAPPLLAAALAPNHIFALRYLYIPSVALSLVVMALGERSLNNSRSPLVNTATFGIVCAFAVSIHLNNRFWQNEIVFYEKATQSSPSFYGGHYLLARAYHANGRDQQAAVSYLEGARHADGALRIEGLSQAAIIFARRGQYADSEIYFKEVIQLDPRNVDNWLNLALLYQRWGDYPKALSALRKAMEIEPENTAVRQRWWRLIGTMRQAAPPGPGQ